MNSTKPKHRLSEIDPENMRAVCSICGPTEIRQRHDQGKFSYYYCYTRKQQYATAYRRARGIPPYVPNPSHHHLSQIDDEQQTAVCSICGPVRIDVVYVGDQSKRRCGNARRKYQEQCWEKHKQLKELA